MKFNTWRVDQSYDLHIGLNSNRVIWIFADLHTVLHGCLTVFAQLVGSVSTAWKPLHTRIHILSAYTRNSFNEAICNS